MIELDSSLFKRIYFVGIKGVGMTAMAIIAKEAGFEVRGSDVSEEFITDNVLKKSGIPLDIGFKTSDLETFAARKPEEILLITTAAHGGLNNPQSKYAKTEEIAILTQGQALGYFMTGALFKKTFQGVSVLGCHGKTTITAMAAASLSHVDLNPSYVVGTGELFPLGNPGHLGTGAQFVAEADEFVSDVTMDRTVKFLYQFPDFAIINNIDFDHPDVYENLDQVIQAFLKFCIENIRKDGLLIANGDDSNLQFIIHNPEFKIKRSDLKVITYGESNENDIRISNFKEVGWGSEFMVASHGINLGLFKLSVPGYHNAKNVLSIIALLQQLSIPVAHIKASIEAFKGTKRRQEKVGVTQNGAVVIDDYAHHPDEIDKTLTAVSSAFPGKKILCLFQPHTLSRTESLWKEFSQAFSRADQVLFLPIFTSKREGETDYSDLYKKIEEKMKSLGINTEFLKDERTSDELSYPPYFLAKNRLHVVKYVHSHFDSNEWVIVTLGAGDLYRIGYDLVQN